MKHKIVILVIFTNFLTFGALNGQDFIKRRSLSKTYKVNNETNIQIINKYGNIHLVPWEKDSIKFEIEMTFRANKQAKVDKISGYVDVELTRTKYYVIAKTIFRNYRNTFWEDFADMANTVLAGGSKVQINYTVHLPSKNNLKLTNKFGNIYTTDHSGDIEIEISNGDLKAHNFNANTKLKIEFGSAVVKSIKNGRLTVNYAELELDNASKLNINSKSSTLTIVDVKNLSVDSKRDKYYLSTVDIVRVNTLFTYINISTVRTQFIGVTKYGNINLESIPANFKFIKLDPQYTDINLYFENGTSYRFDATYIKTNISYPVNLAKLEKTLIDKKEGKYRISGTIGKNQQSSKRLEINAKSGRLTIIHK